MVPLAGLEPARMLLRGILSPLRLPIPPQRQNCLIKNKNSTRLRRVFVEAPPRFELGVKALQARALPLGYGAVALGRKSHIKKWSGKRDSNSRHSPWQGDALPLSHSRKKMQ